MRDDHPGCIGKERREGTFLTASTRGTAGLEGGGVVTLSSSIQIRREGWFAVFLALMTRIDSQQVVMTAT